MKPIIKHLHSPDIENLKDFKQAEGSSFGFLLQIFIGPENSPGEETFDVTICSPEWLVQNLEKDRFLIGRHYLISKNFDYENFLSFFQNI